MTICPRHQAELGVFWRPSRKCAHPLHGNRKGKPETGANLEMSRQIMENWRVLLPVGAATAVTTSSTCSVPAGWALKTSKKGIRFSEKVKTHLKRIFLEGEETGRKVSGVDVCSKLRTLRDESGKKVFNKEDWLTAEQIARYFSRLSVLHRSGRLAIDQADPSPTEEEEEDFVADTEVIVTRLQVHSWSCNYIIVRY
ncbi:hypothetical protein ACROYT_G035220 [Oculina patagonica]